MRKFLAVLVLLGGAARAGASPAVTLQEPPDRFFQNGPALDVVATVDSSGQRLNATLLVDGVVVAERPVFDGAVSFRVPLSPDTPVSLVQVCASRGGRTLSCDVAHAAGIKEFDLLRQTLEEMNEIAIAIDRCSRLTIGGLPETLEELVPAFLPQVPLRSALGAPYSYATSNGHYVLQSALPGAGQIRLDDGAFTEVPAGAFTDREAARLARQQLLQLSLGLESFWVDFSHYPAQLEEIVPFYVRSVHLVDPYGHPYQLALEPDGYALTGWGRDGLPGGEGFDADTIVVPDRHIAETTPYRGRYEYARLTLQDMQEIASAVQNYFDWHGHWPASLPQLIGEAYFMRPRVFTDACGNPYDYTTRNTGLGHSDYVLRAYGCDGVPGTDVEEWWLYYFSANDEGYRTAPRPGWPWPGLFD